jgi:type VI secretion system protein ImpB
MVVIYYQLVFFVTNNFFCNGIRVNSAAKAGTRASLDVVTSRDYSNFCNSHGSSQGVDMARESTQHKLDRVRSPRVHITYDVEVGDAIELKELPFVVGVLGDFTGQPIDPLPKLKERKFVEVNPDNFDSVLEGMKPHLSFAVENKLSDEVDAPNLKINLAFKSMDDFEPENVAQQIKPLKELLDLRTRLADLRGSLQGNDKLEELLLEAVGNTEKLDKIKGEISKDTANG